MSEHANTEKPGLYIHVPFCAGKCCYCDFYSIAQRGLEDRWLDALEREMALYRHRFSAFDTVYVGGGTPSVLGTPRLERLLSAVRASFFIAPDAEITVEANPQDITAVTARELVRIGCNRLSLGVQSFDDAVLSFLTRRHTGRQCRAAIEAAHRAGFAAVSIDLLFGVPGESPDGWMRTLAEAGVRVVVAVGWPV